VPEYSPDRLCSAVQLLLKLLWPERIPESTCRLLPDQHRKSVGTAVMQEIENEINITEKVKNYKIKLTVNRQNFKAINFYFKNGFTIESVEDFDIGESYLMNDFVMVKNVNNSF
jgi:ribosomal protein S18 acetylase RimI-like enzyme